MKRSILVAAAACCALFTAGAAHAGAYSDAFGKCLTDNSTGKDRVIFVRWLFVALTAHPDLQSLAKVSKADHEEATRQMAGVVNRLVLVDCRKEAVAALQNEGDSAFEKAFESFGRVAATELMGNPAVGANLENFSDYFDMKAWEDLAKEANVGSKRAS